MVMVDIGPGDALDGVVGGHVAAIVADVELGLYGLDDDDGVIHHGADHEHEGEEGYEVEREAGHIHESESADKRHEDADKRDGRRAGALQEEQHDNDDEDYGLEERLDDLVD